MDKELSIIVLNCNGKKWLQKCFDSLLSQSYQNFELIMVDNGSTDDSVQFVSSKYPQIQIIKSAKNLGFSGGNNLGIQHSKGEYILLLNNDTWMAEDFLENYLLAHQSSNLDVSSPLECDYASKVRVHDYHAIDFLGYPGNTKNKEFELFLNGYCLLFKRKIYEISGGLSSDFFMYCDEVDWFRRIKKMGYKIGVINSVTLNHQGSGSTSGKGSLSLNKKKFLRRNESHLILLYKNYSGLKKYTILLLLMLIYILESLLCLLLLKPSLFVSYYQAIYRFLKNHKKYKITKIDSRIKVKTLRIPFRISNYFDFLLRKP